LLRSSSLSLSLIASLCSTILMMVYRLMTNWIVDIIFHPRRIFPDFLAHGASSVFAWSA